MTKNRKPALSPTRNESYSEWYQKVIRAADLAENSPVRGCMVIKPWGYRLWENTQQLLDQKFKRAGHQNAYFPLFIPKSFIEKEAEHIEGFAKECAVVTHSRLEADPDGKLHPGGELEEPLIVRPTSETLIGAMFAKWVHSYRDLPLKINQWANVVRWEMRPRLFLRTTEFLWQEGHTAHSTQEEAQQEALQMLDLYADFAKNEMAMPVIKGGKTESERFPGALHTYTIEALMQDGKALQAGTSHFLGQNFAKASGIQFSDPHGVQRYAWTTSWGVSTRLIGGLIMTHSDDDGLVLPPRLAPSHIAILPILHEDTQATVRAHCHRLRQTLSDIRYHEQPLRVEIDERDLRGGEKRWQWIKKGIPLWIEMGRRDLTKGTISFGRRDKGPHQPYSLPYDTFIATVTDTLDAIQHQLLDRALAFRDAHTVSIDSKAAFYDHFTSCHKTRSAPHGGFVIGYWSGDPAIETQIKNDLNVTVRCLPLDTASTEEGRCLITGKPSRSRALFARAY